MLMMVLAIIVLPALLCAVEGCCSGIARDRLAIEVASGRQLYVNGIRVDQQWNVDTFPCCIALSVGARFSGRGRSKEKD